MAAIVEQSNENAFWQQWLAHHPSANATYEASRFIGRQIGRLFDFVFNGHILVSFVRWLVRVTGYTAESALMLAVLWITITSVAPMFVTLFMDQITMAKSISFTVIVLAIIPELILINALTNVIEHWLRVIQGNYQSRTARVFSWIWAIAFTIPTCLFLYLTSVTIHNVQATGNFVQATTSMIDLRCYAGWAYAVLETLYATTRVGKRMMEGVAAQVQVVNPIAQPVLQPAIEIDYQEVARHLTPVVSDQVAQLRTELSTQWTTETQHLRSQLEDIGSLMLTQFAAKSEPENETDDEPATENIVDMQSYRQVQEDETEYEPDDETEMAPAPRITVKLAPERKRAKSSAKREPAKSSGTAQEKALRILKKYPDINAAELAKKAQITPQYASRILKKLSV